MSKSLNGNKACVERKVGECFQCKAHGQCSKGDSCSFIHDFQLLETSAKVRVDEGDCLSPAFHSKAKTDWRRRTSMFAEISGKESGKLDRQKWNSMPFQILENPSFNFRILPCVRITCLRKVEYKATHVISEMLRQKSQAKSQRKMVVYLQWCCVSHDSYPRKFILRAYAKLVSKHTVQYFKGNPRHIQKFVKEAVHREEVSKSVRSLSIVCSPTFEDRSHEETLHQAKMRPQKHRWNWWTTFSRSRIRTKLLRLIFLVKWK